MHNTAPPSQPLNLTAESVSYFWVAIQWEAPNDMGSHGISYYNVTVYRVVLQSSTETLVMEITTRTEGGETCANITGLQPGMAFQIQVAGISSIAGSDFTVVGESSAFLQINRSIPGKIHGVALAKHVCSKLFTHGQVSCFAQAACMLYSSVE